MKRKIIETLLLVLAIASSMIFVAPKKGAEIINKTESTTVQEEAVSAAEIVDTVFNKEINSIPIELSIREQAKALQNVQVYKKTLYDVFSKEELEKMFGVIEAEVGSLGGFEERCNVASVIFNRLEDGRFGDSLDEVLSKDQFSTVRNGKYKKVNITEDTILSCEFVFSNGDTTSGALYFEAGNSNIHSKYAEYLFSDKSGHSFYK